MKKILIIIGIILTISTPVFAEEKSITERFIEQYKAGISRYETEINLDEFVNDISNDEIQKIMENPKVIVAGIPTATRTIIRDNDELSIRVEYVSTKEEQDQLKPFIKTWVKDNITPNMSDIVKAKVIADYIAKTYPYKSVADKLNPQDELDGRFDMAAMLNRKHGVCNSFSGLYRELGKEAGLNVVDIIGYIKYPNGELIVHAWNAVEIDGAWYVVDITFEQTSKVKYKFVLAGDDDTLKNHSWARDEYPPISTKSLVQTRFENQK